jgi:glycosyltransferase involved in cell wall biosynthesis
MLLRDRQDTLANILFSIVIACYNQEQFVGEAVESALSQQHWDKEVIVVDDASSDHTADVLKEFGNSIVFSKLPMNGGVGAARNHGASLAKGKYLVFLDGDDVLMPGALDVYGELVTARSPTLIFGKAIKCYGAIPRKKHRSLSAIRFVQYDNFLAKDRPCLFNTSTLVVDRCAFWATQGWSPELFYQDIQDLITKLSLSGKMIMVIAPETVWYRMHPANASNKTQAFVEGIYRLLAKAKRGLYPGGKAYWYERSAWFGGLIFYWTKTALRERHYKEGMLLLARGWVMIVLAVFRRGMAWLMGRTPIDTLLIPQSAGPSETAADAALLVRN